MYRDEEGGGNNKWAPAQLASRASRSRDLYWAPKMSQLQNVAL